MVYLYQVILACDELVSTSKLSYAQGNSPLALRHTEYREEDRSRVSAHNGKISRYQRLVKAPLGRAKGCHKMGAESPLPCES